MGAPGGRPRKGSARATMDEVDWSRLPPFARQAVGRLAPRHWAILVLRLQGQSSTAIAAAEGVRRRRVEEIERLALNRLAALAGKTGVPTCSQVVKAHRAAELETTCERGAEIGHQCRSVGDLAGDKPRRQSPAGRAQAELDALGDALLAGDVSREEARERGLALEAIVNAG